MQVLCFCRRAAFVVGLLTLFAAARAATFYPTNVGDNGVLTITGRTTFYDGSNGTLFTAVALPPGATKLQFRAVGGVTADSSKNPFSPDGELVGGSVRYNFNVWYNGTYRGVPIGASDGVSPSLFGVFFNPAFTGTPTDSANYESDAGITPDPRRLAVYDPVANQPFWIGDGFDANNRFQNLTDSDVPAGSPQTYDIPAGATQLLLGVSDSEYADNGEAAGTLGYRVHVYSDVPNTRAVRLAFTTEPGSGDAGQPLAPQPEVRALDANGATDTAFQGPVNLTLLQNGSLTTANLSGAISLTAVDGVAHFEDVGVTQGGAGYTLRAEGDGLIGATSDAFEVHAVGGTQPFHPSLVGDNGALAVDSHDTYYDGSDGTLFVAVPLPPRATAMQFLVTGGVITDSTRRLASPDGLYPDGHAPYNFTRTRFGGTYMGVPIGATTGSDPGLFGIFFNANFTSEPIDSLNYRSDSGLSPDPRTFPSYAPVQNQPFFIGDGVDENNPFLTADEGHTPPGSPQTYYVPPGATSLILGIGADNRLDDNDNGLATTGYRVHVFDNSPASVSTRLAFVTQPSGGAPGDRLAVQPAVAALDAGGGIAGAFSGAVTVGIAPGTGAAGAKLGGTVTVNAVNGVANFGDLTVDKAGTNYRLTASAGGLDPATSAPFHVPGAVEWDAGRAFSSHDNPAGPWAYGYETTLGANFKIMPQFTTVYGGVQNWGTDTILDLGVFRNATSAAITADGTTWPVGLLVLQPGGGGESAVLRFTFPSSGVYRFKAHFEGTTNGPATSNAAVLLNDAALDAGALNINGSGNTWDTVLTRTFNRGDTLDFAVGDGNGDDALDATIVDAAVSSLPDINGSGGFDVADVLDALRIAGGLEAAPDAAALGPSDFLSDGRITLGDALEMARLL
jgi:hypothetical protein